MENYSETKSNLYTSLQSSSKILNSCFFNTTISEIHGKKTKSEPTLILSLESRQLEFLHGKTLISFKNYTPTLKLSDITFPEEEIELKTSNPDILKNLYVDTILTLDDTQFLIGFANGFVQRISLPNTIILKTYNPLLFQKDDPLKEKVIEQKGEGKVSESPKNQQEEGTQPQEPKKESNSPKKEEQEGEKKEQEGEKNEQEGEKKEQEEEKKEQEEPKDKEIKNEEEIPKKYKTLILDNFLLPGIESLGYSGLHELLFVNHRNFDKNIYNRTFSLEETPIFVYKLNGEKHAKLQNCTGTILQNTFLENRGLYLVLTSGNFIFVWNYVTNNLILKISLDTIGMKGGSEIFFTTLAVRNYDINQRGVTADKIYDFSFLKAPKIDHKKIDGDLIFTAERSGGFLISKLTFENEKNEVSWVPLKIFDMKDKETQQTKSKVLKSIKTIQNNVSVLYYDLFQDNLYMIDHKSSVRIFKRITQKLYSP